MRLSEVSPDIGAAQKGHTDKAKEKCQPQEAAVEEKIDVKTVVSEAFEALKGDAHYVKAELIVMYQGEVLEGVTPTIYIGVKGDADLNETVDTFDAYYVLQYYAAKSAGFNDAKLLNDNDDPMLEVLAYFLADVDTESKAGTDTAGKILDTFDAYYVLDFYASLSAGHSEVTWPEIIPSLLELEDSCWVS